MRNFLRSYVPPAAAILAPILTVAAYGGGWPNWWIVPACFCAGIIIGWKGWL